MSQWPSSAKQAGQRLHLHTVLAYTRPVIPTRPPIATGLAECARIYHTDWCFVHVFFIRALLTKLRIILCWTSFLHSLHSLLAGCIHAKPLFAEFRTTNIWTIAPECSKSFMQSSTDSARWMLACNARQCIIITLFLIRSIICSFVLDFATKLALPLCGCLYLAFILLTIPRRVWKA